MGTLRATVDDLLAVLLPGRCPGCGARAEPVCDACAAAMRAAPSAPPPPGVTWSASVFAYGGVARELVARVKYRNERDAVRWLGAARRALGAHWRRGRSRSSPGFPRARPAGPRAASTTEPCSRVRSRAGSAWARSGCSYVTAGLRKPGAPRPLRRAGPELRGRGHVSGRTVLVVDDVVTTGATLVAAARVLRSLGAADVLAATVARTPRPGDPRADAPYTRSSVVTRGGTGG